MSLRTVWVTADFPPRPGGIEQFVANLVRRLAPGSARVLTATWPGSAAFDTTVPHAVERVAPRPLLPTPALSRRVRDAVEDHAADLVVFGASWPLAELARQLPVPSFALSHGHEAGMTRVGGGPLVRRVTRGLVGLGYISDYTRAALAPWVAPGCRLVRVPPGVDTDAFTPALRAPAVRARHGIPAGAPVVLCVSRLVARKGQDVLVEAWPAVRAAVDGAVLLLVGTGPALPRLRRRIDALGMAEQVVLAGEVGWDELPAYHAAADLFAMPCRTRWAGLDVEGVGIVYLEAQASGVPVVAGRSGGAPSALLDGRSGLVVDGRRPAHVAEALITLLDDAERRAAMGRSGRAFVLQRYAWPQIVASLSATLVELAARPPATQLGTTSPAGNLQRLP